MPFNRGEVVLVFFPDSNLKTAKRRPALVVQANNLQTGLQQTIVSMITSNLARAGHSSRLPVKQTSALGQEMGLRADSVVMTDNLATVLDNEIDQSIGHCSNMQAVDDCLRHTLGM